MCDRDGFRNRVNLIFDLLTSASAHAERLPWSMCVPSLVLIARSVFLLDRGHAQRHTGRPTHAPHTLAHTQTLRRATDHPMPRIGYTPAWDHSLLGRGSTILTSIGLSMGTADFQAPAPPTNSTFLD